MKRNNRGEVVMVVNGSGRPAMACRPCREKKRRCDRKEPCANCTLRSIRCEYPGQEHRAVEPGHPEAPTTPLFIEHSTPDVRHQDHVSVRAGLGATVLHPEDVLHRLRRLEDAVFNKADHLTTFTPFSCQVEESSSDENALTTKYIARVATKLPPINEARHLFDHFATVVQPNWGVIHVPSSRELLERTYEALSKDEEPQIANILFLFSIFAGAAFSWTPVLLRKIDSTRDKALIAAQAYSRTAQAISENAYQPVPPSTMALVAISCLAHISTHFRGLSDTEIVLRMKTLVMCRSMGIDRLDSTKSQEERRVKGCDMIEIEVQRRVWWNLVGFDWLSAFSGSGHEGSYCIQPRHMNINYPSNTEDEYITKDGVTRKFPLSTPTSMSAFIHRLRMAEISREAVDRLPSLFQDSKDDDYNVVLELDQTFRTCIDDLPQFLRLDPDSASENRRLRQDRPVIAFSRLGVNFGIQTRICRLHRPYYLDSSIRPEYVYSHDACIRAAQSVLELRRLMDEVCESLHYRPSTSWIVMQHVSIAALILAMDVSFNPSSPESEANKAKVLATCQILERSAEESGSIMEGVQRNMQTLISTLQKNKTDVVSDTPPTTLRKKGSAAAANGGTQVGGTANGNFSVSGLEMDGTALPSDLGFEIENYDQIWTDFLALAPELNGAEWDMLLNDIDFG